MVQMQAPTRWITVLRNLGTRLDDRVRWNIVIVADSLTRDSKSVYLIWLYTFFQIA